MKSGSVASSLFLLFLALSLAAAPAGAELRMPSLFSDHMVVQLGATVPVWGWAAPGQEVNVFFRNRNARTTAAADGSWRVDLEPFGAGGPDEMIISAGDEVLRIVDIMTGEVWLCSGQSNMDMTVKRCFNAEQDIADSRNPEIRQFMAPRSKAAEPRDTLARPGWWSQAGPSTVGDWTAVGYFFARELNSKLGVPVGIINACWGGTVVEAWTSRKALEGRPETASVLEDWPEFNEDESWLRERYAQHLKEVEKARAEGRPEPLFFNQPTVLFNGIISPLIPYAMRGATWYQGESNAYRGYQYRELFPTMIRDWRSRWERGDFPFLFVQLANFNAGSEMWPELREAQAMALDLPATGMAVTTDVGEAVDIHPRDKQTVGHRLARAALSVAYMAGTQWSGPVYEGMEVRNGRARLRFSRTGKGVFTGRGADQLEGFTIAGPSRKFQGAKAIIEGDEVVVWNEDVTDPEAVRYGWRDNPEEANLYSLTADGDSLPASPFRTDDWPGLTADRY